MRPSKLKTPLAVLRSMLTDGTTTRTKLIPKTKTLKASYQKVTVPAPLTVKSVAKWLGCSEGNVQGIECGRTKMTRENAELIAKQTDANIGYLLGDNPANPIDSNGKPYRLETFDRRQAHLKLEKNDRVSSGHMMQWKLVQGVTNLAAILLRAFQDGTEDVVFSKVMKTLRKLYLDVDKTGIDRNGLFDSAYGSISTATRPDLKDPLDRWEAHFQKMAGKQLERQRRHFPAMMKIMERNLAQLTKRKPGRRKVARSGMRKLPATACA